MIKKHILICFAIFAFTLVHAKEVSLQTGHWIFDRYRTVDLTDFDYSYTLQSTDSAQSIFELEDGSQWQVVPMSNETTSFYTQKGQWTISPITYSLFDNWQEGDKIIFHKIVNRDSFLAYNASCDMLLDVLPIATPLLPQLTITSITNTNEISYTYYSNEKTQSFEQHQHNNWRTIIVLSDGSVWEGDPSRPLLSWVLGDPIHIAKDTPWWSSNTHILINAKSKQFRRFGVWKVC